MWWILMSFAVSAASITLARSTMFVPYRRLMLRISPSFGHLARCHFCTSFWISFLAVGVYRPTVGGLFWPDLAFAVLALVGMAALLSGVIMFFTPFNSTE